MSLFGYLPIMPVNARDKAVDTFNKGIRQTDDVFPRRDDWISEPTVFLQHKKTEFQSRRVSYNTRKLNIITDGSRTKLEEYTRVSTTQENLKKILQ